MKNLLLLMLISFSLPFNEVMAQSPIARNVPSKTSSLTRLPEGVHVWGVFDGRVRCQEMAAMMKVAVPANCEKIKWSFVFYQDPKTKEPTTYVLRGSLYREQPRKGKWTIIKGTKDNPSASVIQLDPDHPESSIYLLKGDENVLFILNGQKEFMIGDSYLSYTFNRTVNE
jgi:hypothetical protein